MLALEAHWLWDTWFARDGELWHAFYLHAPKSLGDPDLRHWHVTIGHAISPDLVHWEVQGSCFAPAVSPAWDDFTTWTGSVVQSSDRRWHLFYTGTSRAEAGLRQRIGHAVSDDLHSWTRVGDGLALDRTLDVYEEHRPGRWHDRAFRDPWVLRDPSGSGWWMVFTARVAGVEEPNAAGALGMARSDDLETWTLAPPIYAGGDFGQLEVPQVFELGGRWYCLFSTFAEHWSERTRLTHGPAVGGIHFLMSEHPLGPWKLAPGPFLDGAEPYRRYAGKVLQTEAGPVLMGFLGHPEGSTFVGVLGDPVPLCVDADGRLRMRTSIERARA